ncbi:hypothetical protein KKE92_01490 [Candidatus Micrarchaeota archaeon]|nr:hypothetical protein [Candidatus Micrarchaeota archaeon]MBU1681509.1 hypothetical protein [Candidatus Micrarchaeota archaeon]
MTDLRRSIKCSNCSNEVTIYINSELELRELSVMGKCIKCGSAMQVNYSVIEKDVLPEHPQSELPSDDSSSSTPNLDDTLFYSDTPSDTLKDIMED